MGKEITAKGRVIDAAFRREAVRILATSGRTIKAVAVDLGIGMSSLGKWTRVLDRAELMAGPHEDVQKELARRRRENELLRAARDLLKKCDRLLWPEGEAVSDSVRQVDEFCVDRCKEGRRPG